MNKLSLLPIACVVLWVFVYALDYIESSSGLGNPELESGRTEVEVVDIDGDGNVDILSIGDHGSPYINTQEHGIMVWFGDGNGNWSVFQNGNFGYGGIAIGDLNNDGYLDVGYGMHHNYSSTDFGDSILEAALGDGTGQNWQPWDDGISIGNPNEWGMFCTDVADINNDGLLDLGANSFGAGDGVHIFLNNGDGTWNQCFGFLGGNSTMDFCFGDVDADGNADFVVAHAYGTVYLGDGDGSFALADGNLPSGGNLGRRGPSLGDVDNDGNQDIAFCNSNGGVEVWTWSGNNTWVEFGGSLPNSGSYSVTQLCDMNIDGFVDVVAFGDGTASVWLGDGAGNWTIDATFTTPPPGTYSAFRVGGDADHNGYPDIALVAKEGDSWSAINHLRFFKETSSPGSLFVFPVYPRGAETLRAGSGRFIRWACGVPGAVSSCIRLECSTTGPAGPWSMIADPLPDNGQYQWFVPQDINSNNCYIRYTAMTSTDTVMSMTPSAFAIVTGTGVGEEVSLSQSSNLIISVQPSISKREFSIALRTRGKETERVSIYDVDGNLIRDLLTIYGAGEFVISWDGRDNNSLSVPAGVYFVAITSDVEKTSKKIVVVD
ncbi:hypothetical protein AMJ83_09690 [candidate division WOR_3 bacterium SM23_42]|uniref:FlgD/Vpr Ig-like domain-containing protein n=1 Tax=candidate division WOR_3 bacterium SM23_42 TaxID=1703779 RepID=A0A0S8FQ00_UNCW3|nr:MAG: hypothetical protein AMJ83_09690 [candidate division WOR_3 bacterium SM23_42]